MIWSCDLDFGPSEVKFKVNLWGLSRIAPTQFGWVNWVSTILIKGENAFWPFLYMTITDKRIFYRYLKKVGHCDLILGMEVKWHLYVSYEPCKVQIPLKTKMCITICFPILTGHWRITLDGWAIHDLKKLGNITFGMQVAHMCQMGLRNSKYFE